MTLRSTTIIIPTSTQLAEYHLQFLTVTSWLIKEQKLDSLCQMRSYIKAFNPPLFLAISQRLNFKHPDHDTNDPYSVMDVYEAAQFVLDRALQHGPTVHHLAASSIASVAQDVTDNPLHDHVDLGPQCEAQKPSATPIVSSISTSQLVVTQSIAQSDKAPISIRENRIL